jgi:cell division protease FtsH
MASAAETERLPLQAGEASRQLADQWRRLRRAATAVAIISSPAVYAWLYLAEGWDAWAAALATFFVVIAARGLMDLAFNRTIPWPSLFATDSARLREEDIVNRRRAWFWRFWLRVGIWAAILAIPAWLLWEATGAALLVQILPLLVLLPIFLIFNFVILFGPLLLMNLSQIQAFEPGDAEWGVRLQDVRGQEEAKDDVRKVVSLWQSGEAFERAGGRRERGLLFLGAPGTGKTMLAKAIATGFNSPFISIPGSGFAATFIGIDAIIVRILARRAKKLARKWGGTSIVFIDEIDAVGSRRQQLGHGATGMKTPDSIHDYLFFGPMGALTSSGDLVLESRAWRDRLFTEREAGPAPTRSRLGAIVNQMFPGMFGGAGGGLALNQLLVVMDGIDNPPFLRRVFTSKFNTLLDAIYVVPRRIRKVSLRLPAPRPRREQVYFIGATNVPIDTLDPALIRPGRLGRHVWFRTPTKHDREDIFDLYLGKVDHDADLDRPERRDELARVTNGYSPAMVEQVVSMALTLAHHSDRESFGWEDITEAMTTLESGTAVDIEYVPQETRATAIHEAGHAVAGHVYMQGSESTRLSIRMRGGSLGHHQARDKEERFSSWRSEEFAKLVWTLGAMAAEEIFYGENTSGVGGDVQSVTARAAFMVGASAMGPMPVELSKFADESEEETRARVMHQFEQIGLQIMNRTSGGGPLAADPISSVLSDRDKRRTAARLLGQAYIAAYNLVAANKDAVDRVANELIEKREIFGNELVGLLDSLELEAPDIDYTKDEAWPRI